MRLRKAYGEAYVKRRPEVKYKPSEEVSAPYRGSHLSEGERPIQEMEEGPRGPELDEDSKRERMFHFLRTMTLMKAEHEKLSV